jgi:hypothetical protein
MEPQTPLYKTRKFWIVLIATQILFSFFVLTNLDLDMTDVLFISTGGWFFTLSVFLINLNYLPLLIHVIFVTFFWYKTFRNKKVPVVYPIIYLVAALASTYISYDFYLNFK